MVFDQRSDERCGMDCAIEYALDPFNKEIIYEGTVINVSESGMSFSTTYPLTKGQEIFILSEISILPTQNAIVSRTESDVDRYIVAVEFVLS